MKQKRLSRLMPLFVFILLTVVLLRGLYLKPQTLPSVKINQTSPDFELRDLLSNKLVTQAVLKNKWTILNVWASWCDACAVEHPFLIQLHKQGFNLIGLNYKDDAYSAQNWLDNYGNPYQVVLFDNSGDVAIDFGVYGSPETFLIDKEGVIRVRHVGILTNKIWQQSFIPILNETSI